MNIIWNPQEIENRSMEIIETFLPGWDFSPLERQVVKRVIHTSGDPDIIKLLRFHPRAVQSGWTALRGGASVFTDVNMLKAGINAARLSALGGRYTAPSMKPRPSIMPADGTLLRGSRNAPVWQPIGRSGGSHRQRPHRSFRGSKDEPAGHLPTCSSGRNSGWLCRSRRIQGFVGGAD